MCDPEILRPCSSATKILGTPIFHALALTAIVLMLFLVVKSDAEKDHALVAYLLFWFFYAAYVLSGIKVNLIAFILPSLFVFAEFTTPIAIPFAYLFRILLPGTPSPNPSLLDSFSATFFGSGLMEELMKSVPTLIGVYLAMRPTTFGKPADSGQNLLRFSMPLAGIMIGFAAGAGFVYVDTPYHVVPGSGLYVSNQDSFEIRFRSLRMFSERILTGVWSHAVGPALPVIYWPIRATSGLSSFYINGGVAVPAVFHTLWNLSPLLPGGTLDKDRNSRGDFRRVFHQSKADTCARKAGPT